MSTYEEFAKALEADEGLMAKYIELARGLGPITDEEISRAKSEIAAKLGFDVSVKEFELAAIAIQEIDERELDQVAGGIRRGNANIELPSCELSHAKCDVIW